jgi:hypothetical protein
MNSNDWAFRSYQAVFQTAYLQVLAAANKQGRGPKHVLAIVGWGLAQEDLGVRDLTLLLLCPTAGNEGRPEKCPAAAPAGAP